MRKLLEITTGRHPFQVAVAAACPAVALAIVISGKHPQTLDMALPPPLGDLWLGGLAVAGLTAQVGAYWRGELDNGLLIEGAGVTALAAMLTIYATAIILVQGANGYVSAGFLFGLGMAGWWRAGQVVRDVRKVWRAQRDGLTVTVDAVVEPDQPGNGPA